MERITLGLPEEIIEELYWVEDEHRTNELSLTEDITELEYNIKIRIVI